MREYQNIIFFGNAKWQDKLAGNSAQQLAKAFLQLGHNVLFFPPGKDQNTREENNFYYTSLYQKNVYQLAELLANRKCSAKNSVYICSLANELSLSILPYFKNLAYPIIYRQVDNFKEIEKESGFLQKSAEEYCKAANLVSISHPALRDLLARETKKIILSQNAVDLELFSDHTSDQEIPEDLLKKELTLGFWGSYWGQRTDWDLLIFVAQTKKNWAINLIADSKDLDIEPSLLPGNIRLLEAKDPRSLAQYRKHFDVCLIPYKKEQSFAHCSNPIKALEYLAGYKPVVSIENESLRNYPGIFFYKSKEEVLEKIIEAHFSSPNIKDIDRALLENTWQKRAEELLKNLSV